MLRLNLSRVLALAIVVLACTAGSASAAGIPGHYIVLLKDSAGSPSAVAAEHARANGAQVSHVYSHALKGYAAVIPDSRVDDVRNDPRVVSVTADQEVHAVGTTTVASGELIPTGILRDGAAAGSTVQTAASTSVAIVDTGIDLSHPDLNAVAGTNCVSSGSAPIDDNGHGSHVSGTIAARNNGSGVVGAVPGTRVVAVKVLNARGSGTSSQVICGIDWVTQHTSDFNIKVANMSLGGTGSSIEPCNSTMRDPEHKAICNAAAAGVTFVVAAGNSGYDYDYSLQPDVPAAYPEALTVTAMSDSDGQPGALGGSPTCRTGESDDNYASFSNYALTSTGINHTIAGPGVCIRSTWMNGGYNTISGTSMATPNVAGLVAACVDDATSTGCAGKSPAQVIQQMRSNAQAYATSSNGFTGDPFHPVSSRYYGHLAWGGVGGSGGGGGTPPPATVDFGLATNPSSLTVARKRSGTVTISVTNPTLNGGSVSLSANCPSRVSCSFSPNPTSSSSTMTIAPNPKAAAGTFLVTVTGTSGGATRTVPISLTIS